MSPSFVGSIGGIGRPGVFAWGLAFNPTTQEVIVGDYLNFRVRRYDATSGQPLGDLPKQPGEVWATSVDPTNGDIYYTNNWDHRINRYDKSGNFIKSFASPSGWAAWLDIDSSGSLWIVEGSPQSTSYKLYKYNRDGVRLSVWTLPNAFAKPMTVFGVAVAADGRVYLPDSNNSQIQVYNSNGALERTFGQGNLGTDLRGAVIDQQRGIFYTSDASYNVIRKFKLDGTYLGSVGNGFGEGLGYLNAPRQLDVDPVSGRLFVADYGNWRYQVFDAGGTFIAAYPNPPQPAAQGHLAHAADAVIDPATGGVWVADTYNQRFQRFGSDGAFAGTWGQRGGLPGYRQNYPSAIGFDPVNRRVWVGQEEGRVVHVYKDDGTWVTTIARGPKTPTNSGYTKNVTDIDFWNGDAYIADEQHKFIKVVDASTFVEEREIQIYTGSGWSGAHGLAIDQSNGNLFIANYAEDRVTVYNQAGVRLYTFGTRGGGDGQFSSPRDVAIIDDVVYVSDADQSRIQAFTKDGVFLGKFGGLGNGAYQFRNPMGLDALDGKLYVSDVENGRISVFDVRVARPAFAYDKPNVTVTSPVNGLLNSRYITVQGTASSSQMIANIEVSVQRVRDGLWWDGRVASWDAAKSANLSPWTSSAKPASSVAFSYSFPGAVTGEDYRIEVVARNRQGTASDLATRTVTMGSAAQDTAAPVATVSEPAEGATVAALEPLRVSGTATDDTALRAVTLTLRDTGSGQWLASDGSWTGSPSWLTADMTGVFTPQATWTREFAGLPVGSYEMQVRVDDDAGRTNDPRPTVRFTTRDLRDAIAPDTTVTTPAVRSVVPAGPVEFSGTATDDRSVQKVDYAVQNAVTKQWLRSDGTWGSFAWLPAQISGSGTSVNWSAQVLLPDPGSFSVTARATDAAGNMDTTRPFVAFGVQ